jgi:A/G-specific adenine glycosylase
MTSELATRLLAWYAAQARKLPWRDHPDPYAILVSEIMLQQTRVKTVIPYYERWMQRFPNLVALAQADLQDVLHAWEGLGYYNRARNLHRTAQIVVDEYVGELPMTAERLRQLPGIGRYTAGAIAAFAFGQDEAALDGNIRRVLARYFDIDLPERSTAGERRLWKLAQAHLPGGRAADYNQALMDLGATICTPRAPDCDTCPLQAGCSARRLNRQAERPVRATRRQTPHYTVTAAVLRQGEQVLIARRPEEGLLGGLWEFPGGKVREGETLPAGLRREIREELDVDIQVGSLVGRYEHAFTHFRITLHAFECQFSIGAELRVLEHTALAWVKPDALMKYPMGKVDRQIARRLVKHE